MENVQYNGMEQKKSHNNNSKELITCYKCGQKNHIKRNYLIFKFKKPHLKTKNIMSHQEFNNVKPKNAKIFNMIHTILFLKNNIDNSQKKIDDEEPINEQISRKTFFINQTQELRQQLTIGSSDVFFEKNFKPFNKTPKNDDLDYG